MLLQCSVWNNDLRACPELCVQRKVQYFIQLVLTNAGIKADRRGVEAYKFGIGLKSCFNFQKALMDAIRGNGCDVNMHGNTTVFWYDTM